VDRVRANLTVLLAVREVDQDLEAPVWLDPADVTG
jgi:hypothetical protein